ncbi:MAG: maleylacetate reductase [Actinomadura sp.]
MVFGSSTRARVPEELDALGRGRALVLSTPAQEDRASELSELLGGRTAGVLSEAVPHTPLSTTERAVTFAETVNADCVVAVGGGSAIGLGKAVALRTGLPQLVLPTTYAGSEMTPILGETSEGHKTTRRLPEVRPSVVVYDVDLTLSLPPAVSAVSGLNALAHAVEALYARDRDPVTSLLAAAAISALGSALPEVVRRPVDTRARAEALYGAWLAGLCLGTVGMALHHKICHVLGGAFDLPHAETHAVVLPHVVAYNAPAAGQAAAAISRTLPGPDAATALWGFADRLGAPRALRDLGMPESGIDVAADLIARQAYWNPRPVGAAAARRILIRAWAGEPPRSDTGPQGDSDA